MIYSNKNEAVRAMVKEFDAIKQSLITKAYTPFEGIEELTPITSGQYVDYTGDEFDLMESTHLEVINASDDELTLELTYEDDVEEHGAEIVVQTHEVEPEDSYRDFFPMWGWMWTVDTCTENWVRNNLTKTAECGFRIYEDEDGDIYLGIDGAGYDFYEAHWIPLYDAMGLQWHK